MADATHPRPTGARPVPTADPRWDEVRRLADLLDTRFQIPGTRIRFGVDAVAGLLPGLGDAAGLAASSLVVAHAVRLGARGWTLAHMLLRVTLDALVGSVPIVGTVFDVVYRANNRNVRLLEEHLTDPATTRHRSRRAVLVSLAAVVVVAVVVIAILAVGIVWLVRTVL